MPVWEIVLLATALLFAFVSIAIWIWNVNLAKRLRNQKHSLPKIKGNKPHKFPFKLENFIVIFGGIDNIKNVSATNNKIKICVSDHDKIDFASLKRIKNRGILDQSDCVSLVLGNYCQQLSNAVNELIKINNSKAS